MDNKTMNDRIRECTPNFTAISILQRGFHICDNHREIPLEQTLLLTGINPSYDASKGLWPGEVKSYLFSKVSGRYWTMKKTQFGSEVWAEMAYLDLFPIRETEQAVFDKAFLSLISLRRDLLEITQDAIEEMQPKLIVHSNKESMYYWGLKKNTPIGEDANDKVNPWMGYKVRRVTPDKYNLPECMLLDNRLELFPLYEIVGFIENENRINNCKHKKTSLKGSFLMEYVMEGRIKKYAGKLYKPGEWEEIWKWVKDHTPSPEQ